MTQTSESEIKSAHGEGARTRENERRSTNAERHATSDNSEHLRFAIADSEANSGLGFVQHWRGIGVPAGRSSTAPRPSAWWDELRMQQIAGAAMALLFAGLAPALAMAALWHTAEVVPLAFVFTFAIALAHAVLFGLPIFLVFRSKGWINIMTCVVVGFGVGVVPDGALTWPMQHAVLYVIRSVDGEPTIIDGVITAVGWVSYFKPVIYCGLFGALGGFAFWVALIWSGTCGKAAAVDRV